MLARRPLKLALAATFVLVPAAAPAPAAPFKTPCVAIPVVNDRCPVWSATHDVDRGQDHALAVAVAPDGDRVFVAGSIEVAGPALEVLALSPETGAKVWTTRVTGALTGLGFRVKLAAAPDGSRLVLMATSADRAFLVVSLDPATGAVQWRTEYDGPADGYDLARYIAFSPGSDRVYVTGTSPGGGAGNLVLVAMSAAEGGVLWDVRYKGPRTGSGSFDAGYSVAVAPDGGRVYVGGRSGGSSSVDLVTLAYDVPGEGETPAETWAWVRRFVPFTNAGLGSRVGIAVSGDGSRVVTSGEGFNNFWTLAYDADGDELWTGELHGSKVSEGWASTLDESKVAIHGDRVIVAHSKLPDIGYLLAAYNLTTGERLWRSRFAAGSPLETADTVLSPDGATIYGMLYSLDAGYGTSVSAVDAATGDTRWVARMNTPTHQIGGEALAMSPSGNALFAAGGISPVDYDGHVQTDTPDFLVWSYDT